MQRSHISLKTVGPLVLFKIIVNIFLQVTIFATILSLLTLLHWNTATTILSRTLAAKMVMEAFVLYINQSDHLVTRSFDLPLCLNFLPKNNSHVTLSVTTWETTINEKTKGRKHTFNWKYVVSKPAPRDKICFLVWTQSTNWLRSFRNTAHRAK